MDMMAIRRRVMLAQKKVIDTAPKIAEYGKACAYAKTGERTEPKFCVTEWYSFDEGTVNVITLYNKLYVTQYPRPSNYQFYAIRENETVARDWYYNIGVDSPYRRIGWNGATLKEIRFSIPIEEIDDSFAYVEETGQIFFAGKNSPYYGYTNINDMP